MVRDFLYRLVAVIFLGFSAFIIYFIGWQYVSDGGTAADAAVDSGNFYWYSFLMTNLNWIILAVVCIVVLVIFFLLWSRRSA